MTPTGVDPDEIVPNVVAHLSLHCLQSFHFFSMGCIIFLLKPFQIKLLFLFITLANGICLDFIQVFTVC